MQPGRLLGMEFGPIWGDTFLGVRRTRRGTLLVTADAKRSIQRSELDLTNRCLRADANPRGPPRFHRRRRRRDMPVAHPVAIGRIPTHTIESFKERKAEHATGQHR